MASTSDGPSIAAMARARGISEVLHFSTNLGLTGTLHAGYLLPRSRLRKEQTLERIVKFNAPFRAEERSDFDKSENWIDYVNLSISEITTNLFRFSLKWHQNEDVYWLIMSFSPDMLDDDGVYFSTTNNIYSGTVRGKGAPGFNALFAPTVLRRDTWYAKRAGRAENLTTCEQAEVLYPQGVPARYLTNVYVREGEHADSVYALLSQFGRLDVKVLLDPAKFLGKSN